MSTPALVTPKRVAAAPDWTFIFDDRHASSPVWLYVREDEVIRFVIRNGQGGVVVTVGVRLMTRDGELVDTETSFTPNNSLNPQTFTVSLEEGFLLGVVVRATAAPGVRGLTYITAEVGRGNQNGIITPTLLLLADYVTAAATVGWPGDDLRSSLDGQGQLLMFTVANPAAGSDWLLGVQNNTRVQVLSISGTLTCSATDVPRVIQPVVESAGGAIQWQGAGNQPALAGQAAVFSAAAGASPGTAATNVVNACLPNPCLLLAGEQIGVVTQGLQAGDQWSSVTVKVMSWIEA